MRHLRVLCVIADTGSLHKAARELGLAQPSLSTQLRRIERTLGAQLFVRARTGCRPTPLGLAVLSRARPLVAEFAAIVTETRTAAARAAGGFQLRLGATASRAIPGWLRLLRARRPGTEPTLQMSLSANALLGMVAAGRLDMAFVHEVEGSPLRIPPGLCLRVLVAREPQFVTLAADHPAASRREVSLADLAGDRWMVDSTVDGEWDALCRALRQAGLDCEMLHGDYLTAYSLAATGEVVTVSQPTAPPRPDLAIRPLAGDPIGVRLLLAARTEDELDQGYPELEEAYWAVAHEAPAYREWLERAQPSGTPEPGDAPESPGAPPASGPPGVAVPSGAAGPSGMPAGPGVVVPSGAGGSSEAPAGPGVVVPSGEAGASEAPAGPEAVVPSDAIGPAGDLAAPQAVTPSGAAGPPEILAAPEALVPPEAPAPSAPTPPEAPAPHAVAGSPEAPGGPVPPDGHRCPHRIARTSPAPPRTRPVAVDLRTG
ncbi:hypothetical protein ACE1SV_61630 [Streptomyces sp. E-15]